MAIESLLAKDYLEDKDYKKSLPTICKALQYDTAMVSTTYKLDGKTFSYGADCEMKESKPKNLMMLHGGAAASGTMAAVALGLAAFFF